MVQVGGTATTEAATKAAIEAGTEAAIKAAIKAATEAVCLANHQSPSATEAACLANHHSRFTGHDGGRAELGWAGQRDQEQLTLLGRMKYIQYFDNAFFDTIRNHIRWNNHLAG